MDYRDAARRHAERAGIPTDFFDRLITQESRWNPQARSPVGAYGLTQVMPETAADPGYGVAPLVNLEDPEEQLRFGADYAGALYKKYGGDLEKTAAAYNWGAGNADKWGGDRAALPEETQGYLAAVVDGGKIDPAQGRAVAGLIDQSSMNPTGGNTGRRIVDANAAAEEDEDQKKKDGGGYGDLVQAGLSAMETGDLSGVGSALMDVNARRPDTSKNLIQDAMANWQKNKTAAGGLASGIGKMFSGFGGL